MTRIADSFGIKPEDLFEPDIAEVFQSSEQVNELLRSIITNLPSRRAEKKPLKKRAG